MSSPVVRVALAAAFVTGCGGEPPRRPNVMHPIDERRASAILESVFQDVGIGARSNVQAHLGARPLHIDVGAEGRRYGVAYLTREDEEELGNAIPRYDPDSDALLVIEAVGNDGPWHVLVLHDRAYLSDDLEGESHSATTIAAEKKIERDARDFLLKAQHEGWP